MTTLTRSPDTDRATSTAPTPREGPGVSAVGVLRAEWVKLRSVRSTIITLAAAGGSVLLVGLIFAATLGGVLTDDGDAASDFANDPVGAALSGALLAQLIIGVLGVLIITSEYTTGLIRTTLTAVPKRLPVLWSKAAVLTAATFPVMLVTAVVAFFAGQALIGSGGLPTASLGDPGVVRAVVGTAVYLTGIALMGLALGALLRSTAAAIATLLGVVFLLPGLASILLPTSWEGALQFLPSNAGSAFTTVTPGPELLGSGGGGAVFLAWVVGPLILAAVALKRRSA